MVKKGATETKAKTNVVAKKRTTSKVKKDEPSVKCVTEVVEVVDVVEVKATEPVDGVTHLVEEFTDFMVKLQQVGTMISSLKNDFKSLEKRSTRELKAAQKAAARKKRKAGERAPSGFVKPTLISDELASFLEQPTGSELARTAVTREINKYIRAHNLQDKDNGRKINPDAKLKQLLKLNNDDELTYFNLQKYMSPHFAKASAKPLADSMTNASTNA